MNSKSGTNRQVRIKLKDKMTIPGLKKYLNSYRLNRILFEKN
jgi:hypothetical protein